MERLASATAGLGIDLSPEQLDRFQVYCLELIDWSKRLNLTAITDYSDIQINHFLDALTIALVWRPNDSPRVIDVGTGAGVPGLPLKIAFPHLRLALLDATAKKAAFLRHIVDTLSLTGVDILVGRAEDKAHDTGHREDFDLVLSRAVAPLPALVELTLPFCAIGGQVILHKKGDLTGELEQARGGIETLGGRLDEVRAVDLPEFLDDRRLLVVKKVAPTPQRYPRRPGIPAKRPLA